MIVGWVLILVGVLNFFISPLEVRPAHAVFHIVAGLLGVILVKSHRGYTMWVGVVGVLLAVLGFAGMEEITPLIDLPVLFNYVHALLGVVGFLVFFGSKKGGSMPTPGGSMPPTPGMNDAGKM